MRKSPRPGARWGNTVIAELPREGGAGQSPSYSARRGRAWPGGFRHSPDVALVGGVLDVAADVGEHLLRRAAITGVKHLSRRGRGTAGRWGLEASPRRQGRQGRLPRLGCRSLWALVLSLLGRPPDHLTPSCPARHTRRAWSALISSLQKLTPCLARRTNPVTVKPMPGEGPRLMRRPPRGVGAELPVSMVLKPQPFHAPAGSVI